MMITTMAKISLFVLAGLVSGSSSTDCSVLNKGRCLQEQSDCVWSANPNAPSGGYCLPLFSSFESLEADEGVGVGHYRDQEDHVVDKNIDSSASGSVYRGDSSDGYNHYDYNLDYEDEDTTKSYLRARK